jgi:SAM-dependent methyltransferase
MPEFDAYRDGYDDRINQAIGYIGKSRDFFTRIKADHLIKIFAERFGRDAAVDVLDIGCGNGLIHEHLLRQWPEMKLTGIDVAGSVIEEARNANPEVRYDTFAGGSLPYATGQFNAAYAICVMHHVPPPEWREFLKEMHRIVCPGGLVGIIEHNPFNPLTRRLVATCPFDQNAVLLKPQNLIELMTQCGLHAVKRRFILFTPFGGTFFQRFDNAMGWLPLGAQYLAVGQVPDPSH